MSKKNSGPNRDGWHNSKEPYTIKLGRGKGILTEVDLSCHIDYYTLKYKFWPEPKVKELSMHCNILELSNTSFGVRYILTVILDSNQLVISCSCDRKVERLCHHVYYALLHIITQWGIHYFQSKL